MSQKSLFIFAGEQSGDLLGAKLLHAIKKYSQLSVFGVGGPKMRNEGLFGSLKMEDFQVMGFSDVLKALPQLAVKFFRIRNEILKKKPDAVIFIDYPDFNMKMAASLRKKGYRGKLIHYVCPSVWAWRKNRIQKLASTLDLLLSILPFEKSYFQETNLAVHYVGHPLVQHIQNHSYDAEWKRKCGLNNELPILAIFPGSRFSEIKANLALQLKAAASFKNRYQIVISVAKTEQEPLIRSLASENEVLVSQTFNYELMKEAKLALATSGTIVLELGLHETPTVVTYLLSSLNYFLARYMFRIQLPSYTLVNLISNERVFPEFIDKQLDPSKITESLKQFENDSFSCRSACRQLKLLLSDKNASDVAAKKIQELL